ncbi:MAG: Ku protein, partial [Myxococcales bacterium]|nr:Ku protein [Myxococcales bacterium]
MARAISTRTISFGLVSIPVKIYSPIESGESIRFRMLTPDSHRPVKQQYIEPKTGDVYSRGDLIKGYEFAKGQFVVFEDAELKALEEASTNALRITEFVPLTSVDPVYFEKPYYLGPDKGGDRAYRLLSRALTETGLTAICQYAARGKQYLVLLRATDGGLIMQQLRYAHEIRAFEDIPIDDTEEITDAELNLALQLI